MSRKQLKLKLKPWITKGLLVLIKHKQQLYKTHFVDGNSKQKKLYKKYANKLNRIKFAAKQLYYQKELENSKFNMFKTWKIVKSLLPSSNKKSSTPEKIKFNDEIFSNPLDVANNFCDYFLKIGLKLASKISSHDAFKTYLGKSLSSSLFLCPTTYFEVLQEINSLKNKKSCGYDNIPVYFFKVAAKVLATLLSILFNYSFRYGIFPDCLKTAKVVPIFKKEDKNEINNYCSIFLLSTFSKILERLICKRMRKFLDKHSIISSNQYGFRSSLSTTHAMLDVLTFTYDNINDNTITALLLFGLNKAFDTVQHDILLRKLKHYGIRGTAQNLIASFLRNRQQYVSLHNAQSHKMYITCGVSQGSVLGPLLFILYINDIANCTSSTSRLFPDDTCLIFQHKNLADLNVKINTEIKAIENYMNANKLTLNTSKSNVIVINFNSKNNKLTSDLIASKLSRSFI